jgi:hypothetical protein
MSPRLPRRVGNSATRRSAPTSARPTTSVSSCSASFRSCRVGIFAVLDLLGGKLASWPTTVFVSLFGAMITFALFRWEPRNIQTCKWLRDRAKAIERDELKLTVGPFLGRDDPRKFLGIYPAAVFVGCVDPGPDRVRLDERQGAPQDRVHRSEATRRCEGERRAGAYRGRGVSRRLTFAEARSTRARRAALRARCAGSRSLAARGDGRGR